LKFFFNLFFSSLFTMISFIDLISSINFNMYFRAKNKQTIKWTSQEISKIKLNKCEMDLPQSDEEMPEYLAHEMWYSSCLKKGVKTREIFFQKTIPWVASPSLLFAVPLKHSPNCRQNMPEKYTYILTDLNYLKQTTSLTKSPWMAISLPILSGSSGVIGLLKTKIIWNFFGFP
jgi:hypothetical protein